MRNHKYHSFYMNKIELNDIMSDAINSEVMFEFGHLLFQNYNKSIELS